tara:strand:- start:380 stop:1492 length:1113 start_codon:yes stop_codon:yes gene_type:complete
MISHNVINAVFEKNIKGLFKSKQNKGNDKYHRFGLIKDFLLKDDFNGFTSEDLFIMQFIKKGWGQDIATLSNMAESLVNLSIKNPDDKQYKNLIEEVVKRAIHPKVNPYKKNIKEVNRLGKFGYFLEHLNIILGCYQRIVDDQYFSLNKKVSQHLLKMSMSYPNFHADLLPNANMKWSADQAAIIYSLWLFDQNNSANLSEEIGDKWLQYMNENCVHKKTGLYKTEVLGTKKYSRQPRGCSIAYLIHYMNRFKPEEGQRQWKLFKKHMMIQVMGNTGFREYLEHYKGGWTPDSGPIIKGVGVAATGLALNAASTVGDIKTYNKLNKGMEMVYKIFRKGNVIPGVNMVTKIGTDLLSTSIWLNAETKMKWY